MDDVAKAVTSALVFRWDGVALRDLQDLPQGSEKVSNVVKELAKYGHFILTADQRVELATPLLHFHWWAKLATPEYAFPDAPSSIDDFVERVIRQINPATLSESLSCSTQEGPRFESAWQFEVYRAAKACFPHAVNMSPSVGHGYGTDGSVDFLVNGDRGWGIEILREGDRLAEHMRRFQKVCQWVQAAIDFFFARVLTLRTRVAIGR